MEKTELVTVGEFVECMGRYLPDVKDIWAYGIRQNWLEAQDVSHKEELIERRQAARIIHEFLRKERQEPELKDWDSAKCLLDLYDCRVCVNHVAQVYGKGIMEGITEHIFGMREGVLREELEATTERVFSEEKRMNRDGNKEAR